jgi:hypothetical protein
LILNPNMIKILCFLADTINMKALQYLPNQFAKKLNSWFYYCIFNYRRRGASQKNGRFSERSRKTRMIEKRVWHSFLPRVIGADPRAFLPASTASYSPWLTYGSVASKYSDDTSPRGKGDTSHGKLIKCWEATLLLPQPGPVHTSIDFVSPVEPRIR